MGKLVEFYFDFSSPYAFFASLQVDEIVAGAGGLCVWKPILLGPAFKASGNTLLVEQPLKGAYSKHDWQRMGRLLGVDYHFPDPFPVNTMLAARLFYGLDGQDSAQAKGFGHAVFDAYFCRGIDVSQRDRVLEIAARLGVDGAAILDDSQLKFRLRAETEQAIEKGVFGAPFFFVDGEGFWGADRLPMLRQWLESGGW